MASRASMRVIPVVTVPLTSLDQPFSFLPSSLLSAPPTSPFVSHSRTSTRLAVSEQCPSVVSRLVSSSPAWSSVSPPPTSPLRSNLWRCTTSPSPRLFPATTLASTSRTSPSRKSVVATSPPTQRTTQPRSARTSTLRSLSSTTPVRSRTYMRLSWIATPLTSPANSRRSLRSAIVVPARSWKLSPRASRTAMPPLWRWLPPSPCRSRLSPTTRLSVASPSVSSRPSPRRRLARARSPRPPKRPARRSKRVVELYLYILRLRSTAYKRDKDRL